MSYPRGNNGLTAGGNGENRENREGEKEIPIYNLTRLCFNGALSCVDFMDVIMGDITIII